MFFLLASKMRLGEKLRILTLLIYWFKATRPPVALDYNNFVDLSFAFSRNELCGKKLMSTTQALLLDSNLVDTKYHEEYYAIPEVVGGEGWYRASGDKQDAYLVYVEEGENFQHALLRDLEQVG
jgi:hypothetical protein